MDFQSFFANIFNHKSQICLNLTHFGPKFSTNFQLTKSYMDVCVCVCVREREREREREDEKHKCQRKLSEDKSINPDNNPGV